MLRGSVESTFWALVEHAAGARPDAVTVSDDHGRTLTRSSLVAQSEAVAAALAARGVAPGTRVSWQLPTTIEAVVLLVALARLGALQNPLIPLLRQREVGFITGQVRTQLLIVPTVWRGFDHAAMARSIAAEHGHDVIELDLGDLDTESGLRLPVGDVSALPPPPTSGDEVRWIYYSSGTTAEPKGARHTDESIMASSRALLAGVGFGDGDVYPIAWPVSHIGGASMLTTSLVGGVQLVLFDTFDPAATPGRMAAHAPTLVGTAVPFFRAFLDAQQRSGDEPLLPALRAGAFGGAPVPAEIHHEMRAAFGVPLVGSWGLTEFPNATSASTDDELSICVATVGRAGPGVMVRAVRQVGAGEVGAGEVGAGEVGAGEVGAGEVGAGEVGAGDVECGVDEEGELRLRGAQCFQGYVDSSLDAAAFDADGWFRTGDLGCIDADGNVRITGRLKDIIIRNAENISVVEIEELLFRHPSVADAAVLGLPDPRTGERVCAVVALRPGAALDLAALRDHCRAEGLSVQKCPEQLEVVDALPHNAMGKVLKQELRTRLLEGASS
jgi:acyl-CoA synthetase (AMP-forming)/AMP-acid ligase II